MLPVAFSKNCPKNDSTWTEGALRMNHMQVVGTHNSYHIEPPNEEKKV